MRQATKDLDIRILKELTSPGSFQWNFRESYSVMARRIGADEETVRTTLKRSIDLGLVLSWRLIINPEILGCKLAGMQLDLDDASRKPRVIEEIRLVDGVVTIFDFHGTSLRVVLYFEDDASLNRRAALIKSICGSKGEMPIWITNLPHCKLRLRAIDWRILASVMHNPRMDSLTVAKLTGASSRTVNRRLRLMTEEKVAYLIPVRNVKKSKGTISSFLITCSENGRREIDAYMKSKPGRIDFVLDSMKDFFILTLVTDNPSEANGLRDELEALEGVRNVKMGLLNEFIFVDSWLDSAVLRQIQNS